MSEELPDTERSNPRSAELDLLATPALVELLVGEQHHAVDAVAARSTSIAAVVDAIVERLEGGGSLHYAGAGTSGRIATLDAAEMPPTFGTDASLVRAHVAGGRDALLHAVEGAEDDAAAGAAAMDGVGPSDAVVGLSASGGAKFVISAIERARALGAYTVAIVNSGRSPLAAAAQTAIVLETGPEPLTGSTRLKAGTAQKIALNAISTAAMVRLGKVHGHLMVDVVATNQKLRARAVRLVCTLTRRERGRRRSSAARGRGRTRESGGGNAAPRRGCRTRDRAACDCARVAAAVLVILSALLAASIAFVPLDDRPVTLQLPMMLGAIAGERIDTPPRATLGKYLQAGRPDDVIAWLNAPSPSRDAYVVSTDMLAYGGLIASRVPDASYADAQARLREFGHLRQRHPNAWIAAFATIVRLAPTGVPADSGFFAAYPAWTYLQQYANLHDPPLPQEAAQAERLRAQIGEPLLDAYLGVRARNAAVDASLVGLTAQGAIDRLAIGQDDAGPVGLHVKDVRGLEAAVAAVASGGRASIEPGADELGMALVAHALARSASWTPRVVVHYSMPDGAAVQDPLEFAPIATAIDSLIDLCGGVRVRDEDQPDLVLAVRVPHTTPES